ncbi:MAG: hypothetical protein BGO67_06090 [Alphaproteobacteria bacterium 41-28]|nr:MAG: hypothetical protein BGO67_06090 [Alphaproteobacteria bacterium 41-28]
MKFQVSLFALISVMMSLTEPVWSGKGGNQDEEVSSQASKRKRVVKKNLKEKGTQSRSYSKKMKLNQNELAQALLKLSETPAPQTPTESIETVVEEGIILPTDARDVRGTRPISLPALPSLPTPQQVESAKWPQITLNLVSLQNCNLYFSRDEVTQSLPRASSISPSNSLQPPISYEQAAGQRMDSQVPFEEVKQETLAKIAKRNPKKSKSTASGRYNFGCKYARQENWCEAVRAFTIAEWHGHKEAGRRLQELLDFEEGGISKQNRPLTQFQPPLPRSPQDLESKKIPLAPLSSPALYQETPLTWVEDGSAPSLPQQAPTPLDASIMQSWMRGLPFSPHQDYP